LGIQIRGVFADKGSHSGPFGQDYFFGCGPKHADSCSQRAEYEPQTGETAYYQFDKVTSMIHNAPPAVALFVS